MAKPGSIGRMPSNQTADNSKCSIKADLEVRRENGYGYPKEYTILSSFFNCMVFSIATDFLAGQKNPFMFEIQICEGNTPIVPI